MPAGAARVVASVACLASLSAAFLVPQAPSVARRSDALRLNVLPGMATEKSTKTAWDEEKQYEVTPADRFMLREDIKDYAKLTEEELKATELEGAVSTDKAHSTFVPHNHPFAHARLLNVVCRVSNLDKTAKFYESLGFIQLRERQAPEYSAAVMGFGSEEYGQNVAIQFVQEGGNVDLGDGYHGVTLVVPDVAGAVIQATAHGGKLLQDVKTLEYPATQVPDQDAQEVNKEVTAVVADPDGYKVTLIEGQSKDVLSSITLRVFDQEKAVAFYNKMGMKLLKKRANVPVDTSISAWVGYDDDHIYTMGFVHEKLKQPQFHMFKVPSTTLELKYVYDSQPVKAGNSLAQLVVGTNKGVKPALDSLTSAGGKLLKDVSNQEGQDVGAVADVDGYAITLVDIEQFNAQLA